uniref:Uncharacterized protein LOC111114138 n=1 Tax=Crassostrea virginica TaxID=6565 RepID=A0A8B8BXV6_CRAVI|nr:uncharacterized protein LOC111114138 [Crassostrea virginica]
MSFFRLVMSFWILHSEVFYKQVSCLSVSRYVDFVEEGGRAVNVRVIRNKTDPDIHWTIFPETGSLKLRKTPFGLDVYAPENSEVDDRKKYQLIGTARGSGFARGPGSTLRPGKTLVNLRFTLLDNDGIAKRLLEIGGPVKFTVNHKASPHRTEYILSDFNPEIHQDWEFSPVKLTFQANQSGSAIMYARPKEDDIVEGTERFVLSLKRISNRMVSYVKSKLVEIIDDDMLGVWSTWYPVSDCQRNDLGKCSRSMSRSCKNLDNRGLSSNPHCIGPAFKQVKCICF